MTGDAKVPAVDGPDRALFEAAAEAEHLHQQWVAAMESGNSEQERFLCGASLPWLEKIAGTPAATIEGALLKLRLVADVIEGGSSDRDLPMLMDAIAVIEREMAGRR